MRTFASVDEEMSAVESTAPSVGSLLIIPSKCTDREQSAKSKLLHFSLASRVWFWGHSTTFMLTCPSPNDLESFKGSEKKVCCDGGKTSKGKDLGPPTVAVVPNWQYPPSMLDPRLTTSPSIIPLGVEQGRFLSVACR